MNDHHKACSEDPVSSHVPDRSSIYKRQNWRRFSQERANDNKGHTNKAPEAGVGEPVVCFTLIRFWTLLKSSSGVLGKEILRASKFSL